MNELKLKGLGWVLLIAGIQVVGLEVLIFMCSWVLITGVELMNLVPMPGLTFNPDGVRMGMFLMMSLGIHYSLWIFHRSLLRFDSQERLRAEHDVEFEVLNKNYPIHIRYLNEEVKAIKALNKPAWTWSEGELQKESHLHQAVIHFQTVVWIQSIVKNMQRKFQVKSVKLIWACEDYQSNVIVQGQESEGYEIIIPQGSMEFFKKGDWEVLLANVFVHIKMQHVDAYRWLSSLQAILSIPFLTGLGLMKEKKRANVSWISVGLRKFTGFFFTLWGLPAALVLPRVIEKMTHPLHYNADRATTLWLKSNPTQEGVEASALWPRFLLKQRPSSRLKRPDTPSRSTLGIPSSWATTHVTQEGLSVKTKAEVLRMHPLANYLHRTRKMQDWMKEGSFFHPLWTLPVPCLFILPPARYFWIGTPAAQRMHYLPGFKSRLARFKFKRASEE